jgi:hypothetical protein
MAKKINKRKLKKYFTGGEILGTLNNPMVQSAIGFSSSLVAGEIGNAIDIYQSSAAQQLHPKFKPRQNTGVSFALGTDGTETSDVEVEGDEFIKTPTGETGMVTGPDHEQGGVPMELPVGTEVYSKRITHPQTGETMATRAENRESRLKEAQKRFIESKGDFYQKKALQRAKQINKLEEEEDMAIQQYFQAMAEQQEGEGQYDAEMGEEEPQQFGGGGRVKAVKHKNGFTWQKPEDMSETEFQEWLDGYNKEHLVVEYKDSKGKIKYKPTRPLSTPEEHAKYLLQLSAIQYNAKNTADADRTFKLYEQTEASVKSPVKKDNTTKPATKPMSKEEADRRDYWEHNKRQKENPNNYVERLNPKEGQTQDDRFDELNIDPDTGLAFTEPEEDTSDTLSSDSEITPYNMTPGNMIGAGATAIKGLAPLATTIANKLTDKPLENYWENFGAEAIQGLEKNMGSARQEHDKNLKDIQSSSLASSRSLRNNVRGVNSLRALQFANDSKKQEMVEQATQAYNQRKVNLEQVLAQTKMNSDRMRLMGRDKFDMATEQRNDNFWTNIGMNMVNIGNATDNMGQGARQAERNQTLAQLTEDIYGEGNFGTDANGKIVNRFNTPKSNSVTSSTNLPTEDDEDFNIPDEDLLPIELTVNGKKEVYQNPKAKKSKLPKRQRNFVNFEEEADAYANDPKNRLPANYVKPVVPTYSPEIDEIEQRNRKSTRPTTFKRRR